MVRSDCMDRILDLYRSGPVYQTYVNARIGLTDIERTFVDAYCPDRNSTICDIGCGNGREAITLRQMGYRGVCGVDLAMTMLAAAKRNVVRCGLELDLVQASADALPFVDGCFDVVWMTCNIYGHITPHAMRRQAMREMARVVRPGGLVFLAVNSRYHLLRIRLALALLDLSRHLYNPQRVEAGDRLMTRRRSPPGRRPWIHWFHPAEVPEDARKAGLEVVCSTTTAAFIRDPNAHSARYYRQGWLAYVLQRSL